MKFGKTYTQIFHTLHHTFAAEIQPNNSKFIKLNGMGGEVGKYSLYIPQKANNFEDFVCKIQEQERKMKETIGNML
ncbi:MAG: hypothetical protein HUK05_04295 [Prevotella sp.]|nr:hypothetical protein [Prevotella sp.]